MKGMNEFPMITFSMNSFVVSRKFSLISRFLLLFVLLFGLTACASRKTIVHGLDEQEANEILVFLANRGIEAFKVQGVQAGVGADKTVRWDISVEAEQASRAMAFLNQSGLPRRRGDTLLNIFANVGLVPSDLQDKIRFQQGLAGQIANTIRKIDGILDADIQLSFPEEDPLNPERTRGNITASVYVKHSGVLDDPNAHLVARLKRLVAGSVNGLDYDNVTVIGDRARYTMADSFPTLIGEEQRDFVRLWNLILAKESITWFRLLFFSFIMTILLLLLLVLWMGWKLYPFLDQPGGWRNLFSLTPFITPVKSAKDKDKDKDKKPLEKEKKAEPTKPEKEREEEESSDEEEEKESSEDEE